MADFPDTRYSLLVRIQDSKNAEAWELFSRLYQPVVYRLARRRGMQHVDAQDLAQQVLIAVSGAIGRWEPVGEKTRFRFWLRRVVRNAVVNALSRQPRDLSTGGSSVQQLLLQQADPNTLIESQVDLEYRREVYLLAAEIVQADVTPETWRAFELTVVEGRDITTVAEQLGKAPGAIYTARSRVMHRLREAVQKLGEEEDA